jgi:hypothetical protein
MGRLELDWYPLYDFSARCSENSDDDESIRSILKPIGYNVFPLMQMLSSFSSRDDQSL